MRLQPVGECYAASCKHTMRRGTGATIAWQMTLCCSTSPRVQTMLLTALSSALNVSWVARSIQESRETGSAPCSRALACNGRRTHRGRPVTRRLCDVDKRMFMYSRERPRAGNHVARQECAPLRLLFSPPSDLASDTNLLAPCLLLQLQFALGYRRRASSPGCPRYLRESS